MEKYLGKLSGISFYLGLLIELTIVIVDKSAYTIAYEGLWFRLTFLLFGLSILSRILEGIVREGIGSVFCRDSLKEWIALAIFGVIGVISYRATGRNEILRFVVFIWACVGKDMKKVLKLTFWYTAAGCLTIILLSVLGIYGEIANTQVYRTEIAWVEGVEETRYCFGMGHPNAFHCMMLALTWLGLYCYDAKCKWYGYVLLGIGHVVVFLFTDSRTGLLMGLASLLLIVLLHYIKPLQKNPLVYLGGITVVIAAVAFSYFMAKYSVHHPLLARIDVFLSNRILNLYYDTIDHEGILATWTLWSTPESRAFFDLGIVRVFYWFGVLPAVVYFLAQCRLIWCGFKEKDYMLAAVMISITVYSIFEAHYVSDYMGRNYIFFFMGMYLLKMLGISGKKEQECKKYDSSTTD